VLVSPHMVSGNKGASLEPAVPWAVDNATLTALRGEVPRHVVNAEAAIPLWLEAVRRQKPTIKPSVPPHEPSQDIDDFRLIRRPVGIRN
jgi:hypothetical protein